MDIDAVLSSRASSSPPRQVQSVTRAIRLLEAVAARDDGASLAELTRETGLHKTTAWRLLSTLREKGMIRYLPEVERYSLGSRSLALGHRARAQLLPGPVARAVLVRLRDATNETCHLAVPEGAGMVYVEKVESTQAVRIASSVGALLELHCTALGKAYLAFQRDAVVEDRLSVMALERRTERTITDAVSLRKELRRIRERGYALDDRENEMQMRCVGAPVLGTDGSAVAAISVSAPVARFPLDTTKTAAAMVAAAAKELGASLLPTESVIRKQDHEG